MGCQEQTACARSCPPQLKPLSSMMNPHRPARMITLLIPIIRSKPTFKNPAEAIAARLYDARRQVGYAQTGQRLQSQRRKIILTAKPALIIQMDIVYVYGRFNIMCCG